MLAFLSPAQCVHVQAHAYRSMLTTPGVQQQQLMPHQRLPSNADPLESGLTSERSVSQHGAGQEGAVGTRGGGQKHV